MVEALLAREVAASSMKVVEAWALFSFLLVEVVSSTLEAEVSSLFYSTTSWFPSLPASSAPFGPSLPKTASSDPQSAGAPS